MSRRDPVSGNLVATPEERASRMAWYRAVVSRDHAARWGTYREWQAAEARVRELESAPAPVVEPTPVEKKQGKHWDKFLYGKRRGK